MFKNGKHSAVRFVRNGLSISFFLFVAICIYPVHSMTDEKYNEFRKYLKHTYNYVNLADVPRYSEDEEGIKTREESEEEKREREHATTAEKWKKFSGVRVSGSSEEKAFRAKLNGAYGVTSVPVEKADQPFTPLWKKAREIKKSEVGDLNYDQSLLDPGAYIREKRSTQEMNQYPFYHAFNKNGERAKQSIYNKGEKEIDGKKATVVAEQVVADEIEPIYCPLPEYVAEETYLFSMVTPIYKSLLPYFMNHYTKEVGLNLKKTGAFAIHQERYPFPLPESGEIGDKMKVRRKIALEYMHIPMYELEDLESEEDIGPAMKAYRNTKERKAGEYQSVSRSMSEMKTLKEAKEEFRATPATLEIANILMSDFQIPESNITVFTGTFNASYGGAELSRRFLYGKALQGIKEDKQTYVMFPDLDEFDYFPCSMHRPRSRITDQGEYEELHDYLGVKYTLGLEEIPDKHGNYRAPVVCSNNMDRLASNLNKVSN